VPEQFSQLRAKIYFSCKPDIEVPPNATVLVPRLGIPIYVENKNAKPASLDVSRIEWNRLADGDQLHLDFDVANTGERNIRPTGYLEVHSKDDDFYKVFPFNNGKEPVLPGQKRKWQMNFGPVPLGELTLKLHFDTSFKTSFDAEYRIPLSKEIASTDKNAGASISGERKP
jgi:hypothetical protein